MLSMTVYVEEVCLNHVTLRILKSSRLRDREIGKRKKKHKKRFRERYGKISKRLRLVFKML